MRKLTIEIIDDIISLNERLERENKVYQEQAIKKDKRIAELEHQVEEIEKSTASVSHETGYWEGYKEGKKDAFNTPGQVFKCEISNRGSEAYLDGFKAGIEWLNGVLKK